VFPIQRGWVLFTDAEGNIVDRLARIGAELHHPEGELPISSTIVDRVITERVAVVTGDAKSGRVPQTDSMILHGIRSAMCAPLWSRERVEGVIYVDTTELADAFGSADLDLLTALANLTAVAVQGVRQAQQAERDRIARQHLERYHSPGLVTALVAGDAPVSRLQQAEVTVLFADAVGFTSISEELSPDEVAELLDGFFTEAVDAVFAHDGTLDKFIGDAVMAFFGAPVECDDHAERAVRAALDLRFRLKRWNSRHVAHGGRPVDIRIALNSGPVVVGDVGSARRVDYTVLGNTVNVAARLESVGSPGDIIVGPGTQALLPEDFPLRPIGHLELKGLKQRVPAWRVATNVI
jgi:adenylate cyclase